MIWINVPVPDITKINPVVEVRERFQRHLNTQFSNATNTDRSDFEQRYRVGFDFAQGKKYAGQFRVQYGHALSWTSKGNFSTETSDLYLAHVGFPTNGGIFDIGRQIIRKGSQRLLEESNFGQKSKSFDVARFKNSRVDVFAGKVGYVSNRSDRARIVGGSYDDQLGETLIVFKHDEWVKSQDIWTFDRYNVKTFKNIKGELEGAFQAGRESGKKVDGWFLSARGTYDISPNIQDVVGGKKAPVNFAWLEADAFSGGQTPTNEHTFVPLYGKADAYYGFANAFGPRNMNMIQAGVNFRPAKRTDVYLAYCNFALRDSTDGWYGSDNNILSRPGGKFVDPTGAAGRKTADEYDVAVRYNLSRRDYLQIKMADIKVGSFVRFFNGANTRDQRWLMLTYEGKF